jgi:hypothetical protein
LNPNFDKLNEENNDPGPAVSKTGILYFVLAGVLMIGGLAYFIYSYKQLNNKHKRKHHHPVNTVDSDYN